MKPEPGTPRVTPWENHFRFSLFSFLLFCLSGRILCVYVFVRGMYVYMYTGSLEEEEEEEAEEEKREERKEGGPMLLGVREGVFLEVLFSSDKTYLMNSRYATANSDNNSRERKSAITVPYIVPEVNQSTLSLPKKLFAWVSRVEYDTLGIVK